PSRSVGKHLSSLPIISSAPKRIARRHALTMTLFLDLYHFCPNGQVTYFSHRVKFILIMRQELNIGETGSQRPGGCGSILGHVATRSPEANSFCLGTSGVSSRRPEPIRQGPDSMSLTTNHYPALSGVEGSPIT